MVRWGMSPLIRVVSGTRAMSRATLPTAVTMAGTNSLARADKTVER